MKATLPVALQPLIKLLDKDEPRVLIVVGTGISAGATSAPHASWLGLLKHGVDFLLEKEIIPRSEGVELNASLDAAFSPFNVSNALRCAEVVEQLLTNANGNLLPEWLRATFQDFTARVGKTDTLEALCELQQTGALLLTTNYDSLLSDATGLPPITWEQHVDFLKVVHGQESGILHIHGHWQRPTSLVLGQASYDRVVADKDFQDLFKSLWLHWNWLYVGCGNGLADPNLGRLLEWGKRWKNAALQHFFLAKTPSRRDAHASTSHRPFNLVSVAYRDQNKLLSILRSLSPTTRCRPFIAVNAEFPLFRSEQSAVSLPFPSQQEYLAGGVPRLRADADVIDRLEEHDWAFILDVASVGKTTLALRVATASEYRSHSTYYLDLATVHPDDELNSAAALRRLSRSGRLLIVDNVNRKPDLARHLWDEWRVRRRDSKLLLIATRMEFPIITAPTQDLRFFENHPDNPIINLRPTPEDLGMIMRHLYSRVGGPHALPLPSPPAEALQAWHRNYRSALGAFCLSVISRLQRLQGGDWNLPPEAASDWVREIWLKPLDPANRKNLICLAAFGAQELELQVPGEALPHPHKTSQLLWSGLVETTKRGLLAQHTLFKLRESSWGRLILAALGAPIDVEKVLFETTARHPLAAWTLNIRLRQEPSPERVRRLWAYLATRPDRLIKLIPAVPLSEAANLAIAARSGRQPILATRFWEIIERDQDSLAARAWQMPFGQLAQFLNAAREHGRDVTLLWEALEAAPERFAAHAANTSLGNLTTFLETAAQHQRNTALLWDAVTRDPTRLASRAWEAPLGDLAAFLRVAHRHGWDSSPVWKTLERKRRQFERKLWESPLTHVTSFLEVAKGQDRDTERLWTALEHKPRKLVKRLWESPLDHITSFLNTAKQQERNVGPLWEALEHKPRRLAARVWQAPLLHVGLYQKVAAEHGRDANVLWALLEGDPRLVQRLWESRLAHVASFLDVAEQQKREVSRLWAALEGEPVRLADWAWETRLEDITFFQTVANVHRRNTNPLWAALEADPEKLAIHALESSLEHIARFQRAAGEQGRDPKILWHALQSRPDILANCALEAPLVQIALFQTLAAEQGGDPTILWEALERRPDGVIARASEASLQHIAQFQSTAIEQGHTPKALWDALERCLGRLSGMLHSASVQHLGAFCRHAPNYLVRSAIASLQGSHWDQASDSEPWPAAIWLLYRFLEVGREDLNPGLMTALLRRANARDFAPYGRSLANIGWLLKNAPQGASFLIPRFLDSICTGKWLSTNFTVGTCDGLATGLRLLALYQPPEHYLRFRHPALGARVQQELSRFSQLALQEQGKIIQLLGSASLYELSASPEWFVGVPLEHLGGLAQELLPLVPGADKIAGRQLQLWLGLHALASMTGVWLRVSSALIAYTLELWRVNLAESSLEPISLRHRVNQRMVRWLELGSRTDEGLLGPVPE